MKRSATSSDSDENEDEGHDVNSTSKKVTIPNKKMSTNDKTTHSKSQLREIASSSSGSLDCEIWDRDCVTIPIKKRPNSIIGFNLGKDLQQADGYLPEDSASNQPKLIINNNILQTKLRRNFRKNWIENNDFKVDNVELYNEPFKYCIVDSFVQNEEILNSIRNAFNDIDWNKRKMDLYEFFQSVDLKSIENSHITKVHDFFKRDVHRLIGEMTSTKIEKISFTCSFYSYTDYLLTHDDLQKDRAIAFILYLTDPGKNSKDEVWTPEMGGNLLLFDKNEDGTPRNCVKKITPKNNRFIFFKVTNDSFHQVEEILSKDYCRFSVNGWFHTKEPNPYLSNKLGNEQIGTVPRVIFQEADIETNLQLQHWIIGDYLNKDIRQQIQQQMEAESEISLTNYFIKEKYEDIYAALQNNDIIWEKVGPLTRNNFEVLKSDQELPRVIKELLILFQSQKMFKLFRDYTDLDLADLNKDNTKKPTVRIELQRWTPGCYSLLSDHEDPHLDVIFYIGCEKPIVGGETMYVANDIDVEQALVSVQPADNTLNFIYRDTGKFTRYVSLTSQKQFFYVLVCSYRE